MPWGKDSEERKITWEEILSLVWVVRSTYWVLCPGIQDKFSWLVGRVMGLTGGLLGSLGSIPEKYIVSYSQMREERADWNCKDDWLVSHDHPGTCPAPIWVSALVSLALWHNSTFGQGLPQPRRKLSCEMQKQLRYKAMYGQSGSIHFAYMGSTYIRMWNLKINIKNEFWQTLVAATCNLQRYRW